MKNPKLNWVRLPLEGVENCRELGGYGTKEGEQVKWHTFLRSSCLHKLTFEDTLFLEHYGVKTVIDLRGADEVAARLNPLAENELFNYYHFPLAGQPLSELNYPLESDMGEFYITLLEESKYITAIFNTIALSEEGAVLFHCAAGKDRTGVIAMLLLGLTGVERKDIIANYEVTFTTMEAFEQQGRTFGLPSNIPVEYLYSSREYIATAYDYITESYGTIEKYLLAKGVDEQIVNRVKIKGTGTLSVS